MKKNIGVWIDHRKAVVVFITHEGEEVKTILSKMEKHVHFSAGNGSEKGSSEDVRDRQFGNHLNDYYDQVIAVIREADSIYILGPGEAKGELKKRIEHQGLQAKLISLETTDKMTDQQILAKVKEKYSTESVA